ncbi:MAG TPA: chemotaxis-specific protein-glutamate methyltransferase CheB [Chloroflexia bacterium]|nr:chemotaxis-specific protein-glutamate methyltransferase CheB [Chloroflexia bacterium]
MIRVLVCEDSLPVSQLLKEVINQYPGLIVVGVAGNGREAVELNRKLRPDIITMDVRMPVLNGLEATQQIMSEQPAPIVMVSEIASTDVDLSMKALQAGALMALRKPIGPGHPDYKVECEQLCQALVNMAGVKLVRRWTQVSSERKKSPSGLTLSPTINKEPALRVKPRLVAIGSSTGGPSALANLLSRLPASFTLPVLITQHIMPGFGSGMTRWLNDITGRRVVTAQDGMLVEPDSSITIIAPDDCHMTITTSRHIRFDRRGPVNSLVPSVDVMFESVAGSVGAAAIGVILTGMGRDGAQGMLSMHKAGAYTIAQDETSSVVFGMPKEAIALQAVDTVLPLDKIADQLVKVCGNQIPGQESQLSC